MVHSHACRDAKSFAGKDSDLVHWEQSFNCDARDSRFKFVYEQFIRQVLSFQNNAVVVFSNSAVSNTLFF